LESLGTLEEFMSNEMATFGINDFAAWSESLEQEAEDIRSDPTRLETASENLRSILQAMNLEAHDAPYVATSIRSLRERLRQLTGAVRMEAAE